MRTYKCKKCNRNEKDSNTLDRSERVGGFLIQAVLVVRACFWLPLAAPRCPWLLLAAPGCSWLRLAKSQIFHTISRFLKMDHFLYQISTFSYFEGWGTCLAVQPASRMLLAGLWLLPDSGCGLLVLLAPCCFRIPAVGLAALGCPWLLLVASGSSCCFSLFSCMHSSAPVVEDGIDMGGRGAILVCLAG